LWNGCRPRVLPVPPKTTTAAEDEVLEDMTSELSTEKKGEESKLREYRELDGLSGVTLWLYWFAPVVSSCCSRAQQNGRKTELTSEYCTLHHHARADGPPIGGGPAAAIFFPAQSFNLKAPGHRLERRDPFGGSLARPGGPARFGRTSRLQKSSP